MKPNELRIGNYVKSEVNLRHQMTVLQLFGDSLQADFGNGTRGGIMYENCEPIPLTEQWLKDFGFTHDGGDGWLSPIGEHFYWCLRDEFIHKMYRNTKFVGVKHVHQLQNLYFSLTGTELTKHP